MAEASEKNLGAGAVPSERVIESQEWRKEQCGM